MAVSDTQPVTADRPGRGYIVGSAIVAFLLAILSMLTIQRSSDDRAYIIGQFTGALIAPALVGGIIYWVARWATHGDRSKSFRIMFWGLVGWFTLMLVSFMSVITSPAYLARHTITPAEQQGLIVGRDSIRHPKLGFSLPSPGKSFVRYEEGEQVLLKQFSLGSNMAVWVFRDTAQGMGLAIQVTALNSIDERGFRAFARGMKPKAAFATVQTDTLTWAGNHHEYTLGLRHSNGLLSVTRCIPRLKPKVLVVCAQMLGMDSAGLTAIPNGLTVND